MTQPCKLEEPSPEEALEPPHPHKIRQEQDKRDNTDINESACMRKTM